MDYLKYTNGYQWDIQLTKPNGAQWVINNLQELVDEVMAASPAWLQMGQEVNVYNLFLPALLARREGVFTHPDGTILFHWRYC